MNHQLSEELFKKALQYLPGGVNSPVRAFRAVGGNPFFVNKAKGCRIWDVDGNEYVDLRSMGTLIPGSSGLCRRPLCMEPVSGYRIP